MFNSFRPKRIRFSSNPPLPDTPIIEPLEVNGRIVNCVKMIPQSNHSPLDGVHYSAETMSLRAMLNLGVDLRQVSLGQIENDPNQINERLLNLESKIAQRVSELETAAAAPAATSVEP